MKDQRRKEMERLIAERQSMTMEELCKAFGISMNTARADVAYLTKTGAVTKVYGGVRCNLPKQVPLFTKRAAQNTSIKQQIARKAAELIVDGDIIYLDSGTTTMHVIEYIPNNINVTIVTPNVHIISKVFDKPNIRLIVLPGVLNRRTNSLMDTSTFTELAKYQHTKAFMGASGITEDGKLSVSSYMEYEIKRTAVAQSKQSYLLVDASKFGESNLMSYGNLNQMSMVITDSRVPEVYRSYCNENKIPLVLV
ncbi:MAG TPA: DeoR/GlpR transcriptional regulator [Clostridiaceae bacterium]|nr:DeoR/GlpR transcriptional regulator [Clostridiaceae bacterium]